MVNGFIRSSDGVYYYNDEYDYMYNYIVIFYYLMLLEDEDSDGVNFM